MIAEVLRWGRTIGAVSLEPGLLKSLIGPRIELVDGMQLLERLKTFGGK